MSVVFITNLDNQMAKVHNVIIVMGKAVKPL
jgi:hypothetical protein